MAAVRCEGRTCLSNQRGETRVAVWPIFKIRQRPAEHQTLPDPVCQDQVPSLASNSAASHRAITCALLPARPCGAVTVERRMRLVLGSDVMELPRWPNYLGRGPGLRPRSFDSITIDRRKFCAGARSSDLPRSFLGGDGNVRFAPEAALGGSPEATFAWISSTLDSGSSGHFRRSQAAIINSVQTSSLSPTHKVIFSYDIVQLRIYLLCQLYLLQSIGHVTVYY